MSPPADTDPNDSKPHLLDLFLAFAGIAVMGFGGVLPWARRMLVEQRRWLSADEFTEVLALGQFLPGGNIINVAVIVGGRFRGPLGAAVAIVGLMAAPIAVVILAGALYLRYAEVERVHGALAGLAAGAVGLIVAMGAKLLEPLVVKRAVVPLLFVVLTFAVVGIVRVPLPVAVLILAPISVALAWRRTA